MGEIYINQCNERSTGQIILLGRKHEVTLHEILINGRCHKLQIKHENVNLNIINIYGPNKEGE